MISSLTRRGAIAGGLALGACARARRANGLSVEPTPPADHPAFAAIERRIGGRVGVAAHILDSDTWLLHRANDRFPLCSTFKWPLAAQMLYGGMLHQDFGTQRLHYSEADLLDYAPAARANLERGWMTVDEMCEAIVVLSDNTCANLLLEREAFGPEGFTRHLREVGDTQTRLDRFEPELNDVAQGDERDTTTPNAMIYLLHRLLVMPDIALDEPSQERLIGWMLASQTGRDRLRAGFPSDWRVADKTGTWNGQYNATNDVAIAYPPTGRPIIIASYLHCSTAEPAARNAAHAEIGRVIAEEWG
jgi:beta-lactamase class A